MLRIMVVDDEPRHRSGLISLLQSIRPDYLLFEARDGEEAMRMLRTIGTEIVITDIRMPNMDGLALIEKIARKYPAIKTVILSVYGEFDYARKALDMGAFAYILKPVSQAEVEKLLHRLEVLIESQRKEFTDRELMKQKLTETVLAYNNHLYNQLIRCQPTQTTVAEMSRLAALDKPGSGRSLRGGGASFAEGSGATTGCPAEDTRLGCRQSALVRRNEDIRARKQRQHSRCLDHGGPRTGSCPV